MPLMCALAIASVTLRGRISGWVAHADASDEHHSCDGEQLEQPPRADNDPTGEDLPTDAHEGWDYEDYAEWCMHLDAQEYRRIFNISEPGSDEPDFTSVWGNEHMPDEDESANAHDAARGSSEQPAASASTHVNDDDEPLVYLTKYGRKIHAMPHCAALHNSRNIEAMRLSAALRRFVRAKSFQNRIAGRETRAATIEIGGVKFREQWLLSTVTQPLFCVGKLMKKNGWDIVHDTDKVPHLTSPDGNVRVPMFYKNYSLHAKGFIRGVAAEATQAEAAVRALEISGPWLELSDEFHEVAPLVYARRDVSDSFIDCSTGLSVPHLSLGVQYRTTLVSDGTAWNVVELNQDLSLLEQPEAEFEPKEPRQVITIVSCDKVDIDVLFNQRAPSPDADEDANMSEKDLAEVPRDFLDEIFDDINEGKLFDEAGEPRFDPPGEPSAPAPSRGHIVVDGVELHEGCNLKTLRAACAALGIGRSGGKATVLSRIASHLDKLRLLEKHQVEHDSIAVQSEPRQQAPVATPTPEQIRLHQLNHIPYQPWCEHCIKYQARADKHTKARPETRQCSVCSFDYCFTERLHGERGEKLICLIVKDSHTSACAAIPTPAKGGPIAFRFLVAELCKFIGFCGHSEVTLRSDGEPTCRALQQGVKDLRDKLKLTTHLEQTEKGDHQGNPAEQTVNQVRQLAGTLLSQLEEETGQHISTNSPVHAWAFRHAGWLLTRYARTESHSAFELITGRPYLGKLVNFGEAVYARVKSSVKGRPRWVKIMWLGKLAVSDLHFGVSQGGFLISSRSVRRLPKQYDAAFLACTYDMPWTQASFLAGQSGQVRKQKSTDQGPERDADQAVPEVVVNEGPQAMPYPGYVVPDNTPLIELLPPPPLMRTPEPPRPSNPSAVTPTHMLPSLTPVPPETASPVPMFVEPSASAGGDEASPAGATAGAGGSNEGPASSGVVRARPADAPADAAAPRAPSVCVLMLFRQTQVETSWFIRTKMLLLKEKQPKNFLTVGKPLMGLIMNLRQSRLVAREYAHLDPERRRHAGWSLLSLDVSDAFLQRLCARRRHAVRRSHRHTHERLEQHLASKFKISSEWLKEVGDEVCFLKRHHLLVSPELLVIEPNVKYIDKLLEVTGLSRGNHRSKGTPFSTGALPTEQASDKPLDSATATRFRSAVGILMYMSSDLIACQYGIRYLSTYAHAPTEGAWKLLRHLTSYVSVHRSHCIGLSKPELGKGLIQDKSSAESTSLLEFLSDSDWSGCKRTRKSVSSCAILWDNMLLYSHSKTQKVVSLSSAESEYHSLISAAADGLFLSACIRFLVPEVTLEQVCLVDNMAARALACRQGVGKLRHISGKLLWLQQLTKDEVLHVAPVATAVNASDIGTKPLKADRVNRLLGMLGIRKAVMATRCN
ncbi:RE1 [Symbiodinium microadriaticum]|nr:RE1 [Symbiodinium microadriaticum]